MNRPSLLILSLGELGTALLEAVARTELFDTIIVASRQREKALERANNAIIGAGLEGHFPQIIAEELDFNAPDFAARLDLIRPDYLFSAPSLLPWWKVDEMGLELPFACYTSLHLSLMVKLRDQLSKSEFRPVWIGASYPDVINAVLNRTGYGPDCGIGNVQEPIPKIQAHVASETGCQPREVKVRLVAQHAFEYYVLNAKTGDDLPPHLLKAEVAGKDVSDLALQALRTPFPFPYDLHFNRVTASAAVQALRALTSETPVQTHLPGIGSLIGGYPVTACRGRIALDLADGWTLEQAVAANEASLPWDGIARVSEDGEIVYSDQTLAALHEFLGHTPDPLTVENAADQADTLLRAILQ